MGDESYLQVKNYFLDTLAGGLITICSANLLPEFCTSPPGADKSKAFICRIQVLDCTTNTLL